MIVTEKAKFTPPAVMLPFRLLPLTLPETTPPEKQDEFVNDALPFDEAPDCDSEKVSDPPLIPFELNQDPDHDPAELTVGGAPPPPPLPPHPDMLETEAKTASAANENKKHLIAISYANRSGNASRSTRPDHAVDRGAGSYTSSFCAGEEI